MLNFNIKSSQQQQQQRVRIKWQNHKFAFKLKLSFETKCKGGFFGSFSTLPNLVAKVATVKLK